MKATRPLLKTVDQLAAKLLPAQGSTLAGFTITWSVVGSVLATLIGFLVIDEASLLGYLSLLWIPSFAAWGANSVLYVMVRSLVHVN